MDRKKFFLAARELKRKTEVVEVPELGKDETLIVQELSATERDAFEEDLTVLTEDGKRVQRFENFRARLVARSVVNPDGTRMFQDTDAADIGKLPATIIDRIFSACQRVSGLTTEDLKEIRENLKRTTADASSSE